MRNTIRNGWVVTAAAAAATLALAACATTVDGTGGGRPGPRPAGPAASSSAPTQTAQPHICHERCRSVDHAALGGGYDVELAAVPGASPTTVIIYRHDGEVLTAGWLDDERPGTLTCSTNPEPNCVVVTGMAMHASQAYGVTFRNDTIELFDQVSTDTPVIVAKDLDGNGWLDVITEISTEQPSYASGPRYWSTLVSNGRRFTAMGCTTPTLRPQPLPTIVITGDCA